MITKNAVSVVILDDHLIFAETFSILLERMRIFPSIHTFTEAEKMIDFAVANHQTPYLFFLDYQLNNENSLYLVNDLKRLNKQNKIIFLSGVVNPILINNILHHNINGFVSKTSGTQSILDCIAAVQKNQKYICANIQAIIEQNSEYRAASFTDREVQILQYFAQGNSISQTADLTYLSKHTIVAHRRKMMAKAGCKSITELLAYARKLELI